MTLQQTVRFLRDNAGNRVAYAEVGGGPVVICPAWWVSHVEKDWGQPRFRAFFTHIAKSMRVVRYDRPGMGLSDRDDVPPRTFEAEVQLLETVADHVGASRFSTFAISGGGPVALAYAVRHPERIERMCFFNSYAAGGDLATPKMRDAIVALVAAHWGMGSKVLIDMFVPDVKGEDLEMLLRTQRDWATGEKATELLRLVYDQDVRADLPRVKAEALVLHHQGDRAISFEAGRRLAAELPSARFMALNGNNHLPWFGDAHAAEIVRAFLAGEGAGDAAPVAAPGEAITGCEIDVLNRALVVEGRRIDTTPLEWGVIHLLTAESGRVVTRDELLQKVWKTPFAGSNKVEAVVRTLRKKLMAFAPSIETVTGHGYRFNGWRRR